MGGGTRRHAATGPPGRRRMRPGATGHASPSLWGDRKGEARSRGRRCASRRATDAADSDGSHGRRPRYPSDWRFVRSKCRAYHGWRSSGIAACSDQSALGGRWRNGSGTGRVIFPAIPHSGHPLRPRLREKQMAVPPSTSHGADGVTAPAGHECEQNVVVGAARAPHLRAQWPRNPHAPRISKFSRASCKAYAATSGKRGPSTSRSWPRSRRSSGFVVSRGGPVNRIAAARRQDRSGFGQRPPLANIWHAAVRWGKGEDRARDSAAAGRRQLLGFLSRAAQPGLIQWRETRGRPTEGAKDAERTNTDGNWVSGRPVAAHGTVGRM